jgi:membrane fusion protein (multidrug efflux system)
MKRMCLLIALGVLAGCGKTAAPRASAPQPQVYTVDVHARSVELRRAFVGRVSAYRSANVVARVAGVLRGREYREGGEVSRGQLLFSIDPAYYKAQLDADLAVLAEDLATLANAVQTASRDSRQLQLGAASQQTVDNDVAAQRVAAAKVLADRAAVETARLNLGYTRVVAPIAGIAGQQQVTVGTIVGGGTSDNGANGTLLTTIDRIDPVYVNFTMSAAERVALAQRESGGEIGGAGRGAVALELPGGGTYPERGRLDYSGVAVNATTGAVDMRARVPNPQRLLLPGMYVHLEVDLGVQRGVFLVPQQALQRDAAGAYLLAVGADGRVLRKDVDASGLDGADWIVTHGLTDGDRVIVSGLQRAQVGARVVALAWKPAAESASAPALR